ncbi:hypothetical protein MRX96_002899 [Rhipicephalus microplus]
MRPESREHIIQQCKAYSDERCAVLEAYHRGRLATTVDDLLFSRASGSVIKRVFGALSRFFEDSALFERLGTFLLLPSYPEACRTSPGGHISCAAGPDNFGIQGDTTNRRTFTAALEYFNYPAGTESHCELFLSQMTELKRWMTEMNLNFLYTRRLESVNPVDIMVRGSLDLGVEAIISIYTLDMGFDPDYEKRPIEVRKRIVVFLRQIENSTVNWDESEVIEIYDLGQNTYPYVSVEPLPDVPLNRLFHSWIEARRINAHYRWKDQKTMWYDEEFVGATYNEATIKIPIAIIQPPFFYEYGPEALNYGSLGMIIGHEIMHGLDISGWGGPLRNLDEMKKEHNKRALCLRRSHRSVLPSSSQRDELVDTADSENLADFVGTMLAYAAFASSAEEDRKVKLAGFDKSPDQLFFISQCNTFCARNQEAPENYAPFRSRCMVPLRNMPEFSRAFGCAAGTVMNPNKKCTYW